MRTYHRTTRPAFTLTEMLVATALCLFLMVVIGEAVGQATRTFSVLRTAGQLQDRNRTAVTTIRRDLTTDHFAGPYPGGRGGPMLGMQRLDTAGWQPPSFGYLEIEQAVQSAFEPGATAAPNVVDGEGLTSTRATQHRMRFTMRLPAGTPTELFTGRVDTSLNTPELNAVENQIVFAVANGNAFVPNSYLYYSQWAEVVYFMWANNDFTVGTTVAPTGLPLNSLRRRMRVVAPKTVTIPVQVPIADATEFVRRNVEIAMRWDPIPLPGGQPPTHAVISLMGPDLVAVYANRIPPQPLADGSDILVTDAISFEIKAAWGNNPIFNSPPTAPPPFTGVGYVGASPPAATAFSTVPNLDEPYSDLPPSPVVPIPRFDTGYRVDGVDWESPQASAAGTPGFLNPPTGPNAVPSVVPLRINVRSLQIKLRIWDAKSEQTRQVSILQEM